MTLPTALKIMKMSAKTLTKKYGSRAMGLSKRVKAGQVVSKAKKGGTLASKKSAKINREEYPYNIEFGDGRSKKEMGKMQDKLMKDLKKK